MRGKKLFKRDIPVRLLAARCYPMLPHTQCFCLCFVMPDTPRVALFNQTVSELSPFSMQILLLAAGTIPIERERNSGVASLPAPIPLHSPFLFLQSQFPLAHSPSLLHLHGLAKPSLFRPMDPSIRSERRCDDLWAPRNQCLWSDHSLNGFIHLVMLMVKSQPPTRPVPQFRVLE